jgi:hypothetical protein
MTQWDMEVLAANLRRQADDLSMYAGFLLNSLSAALPADLVQVDRKAGLFGRVKDDAPVLAVSVQLGDQRFALRRSGVGHRVAATVGHVSGGIVLRTDEVGMDAWSRRLAEALARFAEQDAAAAQALSRLTLPGMAP